MSEPGITLSISRSIAAPADVLFAHLARPADHADIDGSGLVQGADPDQVLSRVGDVFVMRMRNEFLGDYLTENHVVEFEPERRIAWEPVLKETVRPDAQSNVGVNAHLRWRWELAPQEGVTLVTETYDLSLAPAWLIEASERGEHWRQAMESSLENLAKMTARA